MVPVSAVLITRNAAATLDALGAAAESQLSYSMQPQ